MDGIEIELFDIQCASVKTVFLNLRVVTPHLGQPECLVIDWKKNTASFSFCFQPKKVSLKKKQKLNSSLSVLVC